MVLAALAALAWLQAPLAPVQAFESQTPPVQQPLPAAVPKASPAESGALQPGALPAGASLEARASWSALVEALRPRVEGNGASAITAFDLSIATRVTTLSEGGGRQQNDLKVRYQYLGPGFVCTTMLDSRVQRMRGPDGDWLWDPEKNDAVQLAGKDFEQDRRELSQTLSVARNYLALAEPGRLRIASLERLSSPPSGLPLFDPKRPGVPKDSALARAASLEWVSVTSPDFQVVEARRSKEAPMFRAQIGLDPKTHLPLIAMIWQDEKGAMVAETALLVDIAAENYGRIDGHLVPTMFRVHDPLLPSSPFAFQSEARVTVFVEKGSTLRPKLTPDDFRPPRKK